MVTQKKKNCVMPLNNPTIIINIKNCHKKPVKVMVKVETISAGYFDTLEIRYV